jgi:exonuclease III
MTISIGTFNLNNLFSRFNFQAELGALPPSRSGGLELTFSDDEVHVRTFMGRLVRRKGPGETADIVRRILEMNLDVLAVQEVEHIEILREFNRDELGGLYRYQVLLEGNDPRLIDVGILSKRRIGAIGSHQTAEHPARPGERVFGRDLMQVEVLDERGEKLLTLYNTHMKSQYVPFGTDPEEGARRANERRRQQAEMTARILTAHERKGGRFMLVGDMNDTPESAQLAPMLTVDGEALVDGLAAPVETRPAKPDSPSQGPGPANARWTHRFNPPGAEPPHYELFDQVWLSRALGPRLVSAHIDRRSKHGGDGSDHDPAWVVLDL